jgi:penicillin-binding protein 1A
MESQGKTEAQIRQSFKIKTDMRVFDWKGERDTIMTPLDSIKYYKHFLHTGMMAMEPQTGQVKVWIGGINQKHFKYDHVNQGARQVGSTFKPFVYAAAIDQLRYSPCDSIIDAPYTIPQGKYGTTETWTPKNSDGRYSGTQTLKSALAKSINTASVKLIDRVGPSAVVDLAHKLGIQSEIPKLPSIALGSVEITVHDMVAAYSTFANQGVYIEPQLITRIEDKNGTVLFEAVPKSKDVLSKDVSYAVIKLLEGVTQFGSGVRLRTGPWGNDTYKAVTGHPYEFTNPIAGKTGTTQNQSDGWFIGMVPNLAAGVWVGGDDRATHFKGINNGQGATMALPIWALFMKKCYADKTLNVSKGSFEVPDNLSIKVDCRKMEIDTTTTENTDEFYF